MSSDNELHIFCEYTRLGANSYGIVTLLQLNAPPDVFPIAIGNCYGIVPPLTFQGLDLQLKMTGL